VAHRLLQTGPPGGQQQRIPSPCPTLLPPQGLNSSGAAHPRMLQPAAFPSIKQHHTAAAHAPTCSSPLPAPAQNSSSAHPHQFQPATCPSTKQQQRMPPPLPARCLPQHKTTAAHTPTCSSPLPAPASNSSSARPHLFQLAVPGRPVEVAGARCFPQHTVQGPARWRKAGEEWWVRLIARPCVIYRAGLGRPPPPSLLSAVAQLLPQNQLLTLTSILEKGNGCAALTIHMHRCWCRGPALVLKHTCSARPQTAARRGAQSCSQAGRQRWQAPGAAWAP